MNTEGKGLDIHNFSIGVMRDWFDRDYMADLTSKCENKFNQQLYAQERDSDNSAGTFDQFNGVNYQNNSKRWDQSFSMDAFGSFAEDADYIKEHLFEGAELYFRTLMEASGVRESAHRTIDNGLKVQRTPPGGGFNQAHWEQGPGLDVCSRYAVWMIYLNDVPNGGKTTFPIQNMDVTPQAGTLLVWPAAYTHPHHGNPPIDCWKYVITGWFKYTTAKVVDDEYEQYGPKESSD